MAKQVYECNWVPSRVTEAQLDDLVLIGALGSKDTIHWRAPGKECPPTPQEGEVVVENPSSVLHYVHVYKDNAPQTNTSHTLPLVLSCLLPEFQDVFPTSGTTSSTRH